MSWHIRAPLLHMALCLCASKGKKMWSRLSHSLQPQRPWGKLAASCYYTGIGNNIPRIPCYLSTDVLSRRARNHSFVLTRVGFLFFFSTAPYMLKVRHRV